MQFQVMGESGYTRPCLVALDTVLSGPSDVQRATVLTKDNNRHLFILWESVAALKKGTIIPAGFASGYGGEGARGFSLALCMLSEHQVPIDHLEVTEPVFDQIDGGDFPDLWQLQISGSASPREMPIPGWTFVNHWEFTQRQRLWRVQSWRWRDNVIEWTDSANIVDDFNWEVGDKLDRAVRALTRNAQTEDSQHVGLILRDAWLEFSRVVRKGIEKDTKGLGRSDVKGVVDALDLPQTVAERAKRAYNSTNSLQHDLRAAAGDAVVCFNDSTEAMAEVIDARFRGVHDPMIGALIRPN